MKFLFFILLLLFSCNKEKQEKLHQQNQPKKIDFDSLSSLLANQMKEADSMTIESKNLNAIHPEKGINNLNKNYNLLELGIYHGNSSFVQTLTNLGFFKKFPFNEKRSIAALTVFIDRFASDYEMEGLYAENPDEEFYNIFKLLVQENIILDVDIPNSHCSSKFIFATLQPYSSKILDFTLQAGVNTNVKTRPCLGDTEVYTIFERVKKISVGRDYTEIRQILKKHNVDGF